MGSALKFVKDNQIYFIIVVVLVLAIIVFAYLKYRSKLRAKYHKVTVDLDREKVRAINTPVDHELAKLNYVIKNKDLLIVLNELTDRWNELKKNRVSLISDLILDIEANIDCNRLKGIENDIKKCRSEIELLNTDILNLYDEITELSKVEEEMRARVIVLKQSFRSVKKEYVEKEAVLIYMRDVLDEKFDSISNMIMDLESFVNVNEYEEADSRFEAITNEIDVLAVLVDRLPDLIIIVKQYIPRQLTSLENYYNKLIDSEIYLNHLEFDKKITEIKELTNNVIEKMKALSFSEIEAEIDGMSSFVVNMETLLEDESKQYYVYVDKVEEFRLNLEEINSLINQLTIEIERVKAMYELHDFDESEYLKYAEDLSHLSKQLLLYEQMPNTGELFSGKNFEVTQLNLRAVEIVEDIKNGTKKVLRLRADEQRAREQIIEIQYLVDQSKLLVRQAKLPVIPSDFHTYIADAKDGIRYIIEELEKTPIDVDSLNKRVDTSLELAYKLYNRAKIIVKEAKLTEVAIMYGNRYRSSIKTVDSEIILSEQLFYQGNYNDALSTVVNILEKTEPGIYSQLKKYFEGGNKNETDLL